jgi:hypothetical protein
MGENSNVFQIMQLGVETTHGTAVPANKLLQDVFIKPDINYEGGSFKPTGFLLPTVSYPNREWGVGAINGRPGYNTLAYLFNSVFKHVTPTRNIPSTGLSYTWGWDPSSNAEETVDSFTHEFGSADWAEKYAYMLINGVELGGTRSDLTLGGTTLSQKVTDDVTLTATPTTVPSVLLLADQGDIFLADTQAELDAAEAQERVFEWKFSWTDRFAPVWPIRSTNPSWAVHGFSDTLKATASLKMAINADNAAFLTAMRAGAAKWMRIQYTGTEIEDGYNYLFQVDCKIGVNKPNNRDAVDTIATRGWDFDILHDGTWGKGVSVKLVNMLTSL